MPSLKNSMGNRDFISLDDVCYLLAEITAGKDEIGQPIIKEKAFMTFCSKLSITRAEHATAGQLGHKPEIVLVIDADAYDDEKKAEYSGRKYNIYKSYMRPDGFIEIYCEGAAND